jgi:hypothetical protein
MLRTPLLLLAGLVCSGCASTGKDFDDTKAANIKTGTTTRAEIEQWFGAPTSRTPLSNTANGAVLRYQYTHGKASWGGASSSGKSLVVDFDAKDVVVDHALAKQ